MDGVCAELREGSGYSCAISSPGWSSWRRSGSRLWFLGLQGSFGRGEGTAESDIDAVVILDRVDPEDLQRYSGLLDRLPYREKTCGFVCGRTELQNWDPSDLFSLCMDTVPLIGSLEELRSRISSSDIQRAVWTGVCTLYHLCAHNLIHERNGDILRGLYKSAAFTLRAIAYLQTGRYESRMEPLAALLQPEERRILTCSQELRGGKGELPAPDFRRYSDVLLSWAAGWIARRGGGEGSQ